MDLLPFCIGEAKDMYNMFNIALGLRFVYTSFVYTTIIKLNMRSGINGRLYI